MGNFYTNYMLRGPSQQAVAKAIVGRKAVVTPAQNECVVVFDEQSDEQDQEVIGNLAAHLSGQFQCPVLAILNHDDDILWYQLYNNGTLSDQYDSSPGYFDPTAEPSTPAGGDAARLSAAFCSTDPAALENILRKSSYDDDGYTFECERHADLMNALGLPKYGVGTAYESFENDEYPDGLSMENIIRCE